MLFSSIIITVVKVNAHTEGRRFGLQLSWDYFPCE